MCCVYLTILQYITPAQRRAELGAVGPVAWKLALLKLEVTLSVVLSKQWQCYSSSVPVTRYPVWFHGRHRQPRWNVEALYLSLRCRRSQLPQRCCSSHAQAERILRRGVERVKRRTLMAVHGRISCDNLRQLQVMRSVATTRLFVCECMITPSVVHGYTGSIFNRDGVQWLILIFDRGPDIIINHCLYPTSGLLAGYLEK